MCEYAHRMCQVVHPGAENSVEPGVPRWRYVVGEFLSLGSRTHSSESFRDFWFPQVLFASRQPIDTGRSSNTQPEDSTGLPSCFRGSIPLSPTRHGCCLIRGCADCCWSVATHGIAEQITVVWDLCYLWDCFCSFAPWLQRSSALVFMHRRVGRGRKRPSCCVLPSLLRLT